MDKRFLYVFLERNLGNGYEKACPDIPLWLRRFYYFVIGKPSNGFSRSKHFKYLIFHKEEIDEDCPDPRSKGRSPKIIMNVVFPRNFEEKHLFSKAANDLLDQCWETAKLIRKRGKNTSLSIECPESWYKQHGV